MRGVVHGGKEVGKGSRSKRCTSIWPLTGMKLATAFEFKKNAKLSSDTDVLYCRRVTNSTEARQS